MSAALIAAAQEARNYLECIPESDAGGDDDARKIARRLSAALAAAQEQEPVAEVTEVDLHADHQGPVEAYAFLPVGTKLYAAAPAPAPVAQPDTETVIPGLHSITNEDDGVLTLRFADEASAETFMSSNRGDSDEAMSMRADAAPIAQPLTDDAAIELVAQYGNWSCHAEQLRLIRATERAHGIGAQEQQKRLRLEDFPPWPDGVPEVSGAQEQQP